ncbi:MAG: ABC transporter substrate-binding protein [Acidimicrobiales bacterium]
MPIQRLLALLCALALFAAACGDDGESVASESDSSESSTDDQQTDEGAADDEMSDEAEAQVAAPSAEASSYFPVTIESDGGTWTLESAPGRIVSLSPTATEILFAIGAGDQIVAVDSYSYFPEQAPVTDLSGFDPNVEALIAFEPDFVVISNDANDLVASLTELDIPVLVSSAPADIEGGYETMAELGVATGHVDQTATVIAGLRDEIAAAFAGAPDTDVRVYHELGDSLFSASSFGFVGSVYAEMGASNIADEADADKTGFPQLTEEYIIAADPELIVITDQVGYTADDLAARPGWSEVAAVKSGNIVTVNADIASRWGPRLPQFIQAVADAAAAMPVGS